MIKKEKLENHSLTLDTQGVVGKTAEQINFIF